MRRTFALAYTAFFLAGIATTMLGPLLPSLQSDWHLGDAGGGLLFAAQFLASSCAAASVGWLARRRGHLALLAPGLLLVAAGAFGLSASRWPTALLFIACYGVGLGLVIPAGNLGLAAACPGASARPLALLNLAWCTGAVLAPALIAPRSPLFLPVFSICAAALGLAAWILPAPVKLPTAAASAQPRGRATLIAAALLFFYSGTENIFNAWMPSHALRITAEGSFAAALPSVFWLAMLAGRSLTAPLLGRMSVHVLVCGSLASALVAAALLVCASGPAWLLTAGILGGLGLAPVFPLTVSQYTEAGGVSGTSGLLFVLSGVGGALLPSLAGYISGESHELGLGISVILFSIALMFWLQFRLAGAGKAFGHQ